MADDFRDTCDTILIFRSHSDRSVRSAVIVMIPILAGYNPQIFAENFLTTSMSFLLQRLDGNDGPIGTYCERIAIGRAVLTAHQRIWRSATYAPLSASG